MYPLHICAYMLKYIPSYQIWTYLIVYKNLFLPHSSSSVPFLVSYLLPSLLSRLVPAHFLFVPSYPSNLPTSITQPQSVEIDIKIVQIKKSYQMKGTNKVALKYTANIRSQSTEISIQRQGDRIVRKRFSTVVYLSCPRNCNDRTWKFSCGI